MGTKVRLETSRATYDCGKGEFVFYCCEAEQWLYIDNPIERWFEMHIICEFCADKFIKYRPILLSNDGYQRGWKIIIPEPDQAPLH